VDVDGRCCCAAAAGGRFLLCEPSSSSFSSAAGIPPPAPTGITLFGPSEERFIVVYCMRMVWSCFDGRRVEEEERGAKHVCAKTESWVAEELVFRRRTLLALAGLAGR
jgi:hypothetical protein